MSPLPASVDAAFEPAVVDENGIDRSQIRRMLDLSPEVLPLLEATLDENKRRV